MENDNENVEAQKPVEKKTKKQEKDNKELVKNTVEINPDLNVEHVEEMRKMRKPD